MIRFFSNLFISSSDGGKGGRVIGTLRALMSTPTYPGSSQQPAPAPSMPPRTGDSLTAAGELPTTLFNFSH